MWLHGVFIFDDVTSTEDLYTIYRKRVQADLVENHRLGRAFKNRNIPRLQMSIPKWPNVKPIIIQYYNLTNT